MLGGCSTELAGHFQYQQQLLCVFYVNLDARARKRSTVRASYALARRTSIQQVEELIAKQLNETDSNHTVTRSGEQVDGGTYVDGTHRESLPATSLRVHQHGVNATLNGSEDQIVTVPP